jgi:arylsulfatase A-like enzyme
VQRSIAEYYSMVSHMDHWIGRIHQALAETGQLDNTIIVHTADHGLAVGQHGLLGKQNLYEHSIRVPLIIAGPGLPAGAVRDGLCYQHDLHPTLLNMAGVGSDGVFFEDLQPLLTGHSAGRPRIFSHYRNEQCAVRDDRYKLIEYPEENRIELYDLADDPWEVHNLAEQQDHAPRIRQMRALLADDTLQANMGAIFS